MFFMNDNEEYLEVELGPWGQHLLLMLKGQRTTIKHSLPLDYVVTSRVSGIDGQPVRHVTKQSCHITKQSCHVTKTVVPHYQTVVPRLFLL